MMLYAGASFKTREQIQDLCPKDFFIRFAVLVLKFSFVNNGEWHPLF